MEVNQSLRIKDSQSFALGYVGLPLAASHFAEQITKTVVTTSILQGRSTLQKARHDSDSLYAEA